MRQVRWLMRVIASSLRAGKGLLALKTLQRAGKSAQSASEFLRGTDITVGSRLG